MRETGIIIKTNERTATVRINKAQSCSHCNAGCMEREGSMIAEAENPIGANLGDTVSLEINSKTALTATFIVFGLPLLMMFIGVFIADFIKKDQLFSIITGVVMLLLTLIPVKAYDKYLKKIGKCSIIIIEILN